jgi:hypothetical protein
MIEKLIDHPDKLFGWSRLETPTLICHTFPSDAQGLAEKQLNQPPSSQDTPGPYLACIREARAFIRKMID